MTLTIDKCNGCMYYTKINTYTTSPSTTLDDLIDKDRDEYYTCSKPYTVRCPRECGCSPYTTKKINTYTSSMITHKCIICGNSCMDSVCDECKEAVKKLKEMLENEN